MVQTLCAVGVGVTALATDGQTPVTIARRSLGHHATATIVPALLEWTKLVKS
jgi:hypothetical protein